MSPNPVCPSCGATLEENTGSACPYCGSALSAKTILSTPAKKKKAAESSAESMDEVKKLIREGDQAGAAEVASAAFDLTPEAAQTVVEQTALEIKPAATRDSEPEVILEPSNSAFYNANAKPAVSASFSSQSDGRTKTISGRWAVSLGVGGTILLCSCCCCLPLALALFGIISRSR